MRDVPGSLHLGYSALMSRAHNTQIRLLAWTLVGASSVLVAFTVASVWGNMWVAWSDKCVLVFHGQLAVRWGFNNPSQQILSSGGHVRWFDADWEWWRPVYQRRAFNAINVPLWVMPVVLTPCAVWAMRRHRTLATASGA